MYIVYYDRRNTENTMTDVYLARSLDGGETFYNYCISNSPFETTLQQFLGDYINITAYNGKVYAVWTQSTLIGRNIILTKIDESALNVKHEDIITTFTLYQNYPNPFNPVTTISYQIPRQSFVSLKVFDILGSEVVTLVNEEKAAGYYEINFSGKGLSSGVYFYTISAGKYHQTRKMVLLK